MQNFITCYRSLCLSLSPPCALHKPVDVTRTHHERKTKGRAGTELPLGWSRRRVPRPEQRRGLASLNHFASQNRVINALANRVKLLN